MKVDAPADTAWQGYSLAERDHRWGAVRRGAIQAGFDCIFVPLGNGADARYLSLMGEAAVVLPSDGRPPIVVNDRGSVNPWVSEARAAGREWDRPMAEALIDAGMERARIGVSGLRMGRLSHIRAYGGVVSHGSYAAVVRQLPSATFEDATDIVGAARCVKSSEEIECLRRAASIAEAGIEVLAEVARPGVDEAVLYARVTARLMELGSEYHAWALTTGPLHGRRTRFTDPPLGRRLESGTYITNEVDAAWGGLIAQEVQPIFLGAVSEEWKPAIELQREVFEAGLAFIKPGATFGELIDFTEDFGRKRGMRTATHIHGQGLGGDGPLITPREMSDGAREVPIEEGHVCVWKPHATTADGRHSFSWGGDVVVRKHGAEQLFARPHGLIAIAD